PPESNARPVTHVTARAVNAALTTALPFLSTPTATPALYTLSLHDALPISSTSAGSRAPRPVRPAAPCTAPSTPRPGELRPCRGRDRKSTRLNSSHVSISYAVFCLKKKNAKVTPQTRATELACGVGPACARR